MGRKLRKGDTVEWDGPQGRTTGVVQEVVTREIRVRGTRLQGSEDDPVYIVRSPRPGGRAGHRDVALRHRP
jgi:hypothetical protein